MACQVIHRRRNAAPAPGVNGKLTRRFAVMLVWIEEDQQLLYAEAERAQPETEYDSGW